ncbi:hypothetical protein DERF_007765 [Dermatophagoides farinae]|uniref:Uncharacterized protein n=1 Tax=Dermatophagoides farinae TaxID=6954 RepID=A0A922I129_DERFA|nr:hypothetical protein DERF_007765 [Dermatophagoides farinae]
MGASVCRNLHIPVSNTVQRRHDLKGSRFEDEYRRNHKRLNIGIGNKNKKNKNKNGIKQRVQVQPIGERLAEVNSSYLNHNKSQISLDQTNGFIEELNCEYCEKNTLIGDNKSDVLNKNNHQNHRNNQQHQHHRTPLPDQRFEAITVVPNNKMNKPLVMDKIMNTPTSMLSGDDNRNDDESNPEKSEENSLSDPSSSSSSPPPANEDSFPVISEHDDDERLPGSISPILYQSISTIPMCIEEEEDEDDDNDEVNDDENDDNINDLPGKNIDENNRKEMLNNQFMAISNHKFPRKKCRSLPRLDSKFNLLIQNWSDLDLLPNESEDNIENNHDENKYCEFCDYINGTDKTPTWTDLDKDVSMLMNMADRLGMMIMEKEKDKEGRVQKITNKSVIYKKEDIVEEKKISLSYLEKLNNSMDLKQKVHFLRRKRQVGISVMKTSGGKCLMDFNDGQNTYQIQMRHLVAHIENVAWCSTTTDSN